MPNSCLSPTLNLPNSSIESDSAENADAAEVGAADDAENAGGAHVGAADGAENADDADCAAADNDADANGAEKADLSTAWEFLKDNALQQPVHPIPD